MKKKFVGMLTLLFCLCGSSTMAQNNERELLIDSIVHLSFNQSGRIKMIEAAKKLIKEESQMDPIVAEAILYYTGREMVKPIVAESYSKLTEEQLKEVIHYMNSEANRRVSSNEVAEKMALYLMEDLFGNIASMLGSTSWKSEVPALKDKEYAALVDRYLEMAGTLSMFDEVMDPLMANLKKEIGASGARMFTSMIKQIQKNFPAYYKAALVDYVSKEQLQEVIAFYSQPYMVEIQQRTKNSTMSLLDGMMKDPEAFSKKAMEYFGDFTSIKDTAAVVRDYISNLPNMSIVNKVEPIYPVKTLSMKRKATYTGQTRDGLAHGKGVLTDKKGVRYSGDFKEGKRHGVITIHYANDSITHIWADDEMLEELNTDIEKRVSCYYEEKAMGYGRNNTNSGKEKGLFIDGVLEGEGERVHYDGKKTEKGWFKNGSLVNGLIVEKTDDKITSFEGELSESLTRNFRVGTTRTITQKDGKKTAMMKEGILLNGEMQGKGLWEYAEDGFSSRSEGFFAYNELYGQGRRIRRWNENNIIEAYEGEFFAGKYQGKGVKKYTFTDKNNITYNQITEGHFYAGKLKGDMLYKEQITNLSGSWTFTRFGFGVQYNSKASNDSLTIYIKGTVTNKELNGDAEIILSNGDYHKGLFKYGKFIEGSVRITYSNGSLYEGGYKNGKFEGEGKLTYSNGVSEEGTFMYGTCVNGVRKNKRGAVIGRIR